MENSQRTLYYTLLTLSFDCVGPVCKSLSDNVYEVYHQACTILDVGIASADITFKGRGTYVWR